MPRQTFYNLPKEKQQTLVTAAKNEFSRVPLAEASVANIIKEAEIPRGSFYQYFEDKDDLYFYILNEHAKEIRIEFIKSLKKHQGDIFKSITELFYSLLQKIDKQEKRQFYRNVFLNMNYRIEKTILNNMNYSEFDKQYLEIKPLINTVNLSTTNEDEVFQIVQILSTVMIHNIVQKFAKGLTQEEVVHQYETQVELLKTGFIKSPHL